MSNRQSAPYGSWKSPIQSKAIASGTLRLSQPCYDGNDLYWLEGRPTESGRQVLVRRTSAGIIQDVTPAPFNVRTLCQEYGGGAYIVRNGIVYFSNFPDRRLYKITAGAGAIAPGTAGAAGRTGAAGATTANAITPLTPEGNFNYADADLDILRKRLICVQEDHSQPNNEVVTTIVSVPLSDDGTVSTPVKLISGNDFYSNPRVSHDGSYLAWIAWDHPNMPWDGSSLWIGIIDEWGNITKPRKVAGGVDESIVQPEWSPNGDLYFTSDRSGWWNIYAFPHPLDTLDPVHVFAAENEFASPPWVFGMSTYTCLTDQKLFCTFNENGSWSTATLKIDPTTNKGTLERIESPYTDYSYIKSNQHHVVMCAGSPTQAQSIVEFNLLTNEWENVKCSTAIALDPAYVSVPIAIEFPSERKCTAHAFYYAPCNADYEGEPNELPPLLVKSHGGPTAAASNTLNPGIQYWTSRGFAVIDVNYGGSSNYGRQYRQRLTLHWGVIDREDCENAAKYLAAKGLVDPKRMVITGGSAGGYTTLCALTFGKVFAAGASHYGVSNLESLAQDTHKFESRYLDRLVGPYPTFREVYYKRSPINFPDQLECPTIFFQGTEDKVVPPDQAEIMVEALRKKGLPVCYISYEGEQHGFRKAENISRTIDAEFLFYARIFGFQPADRLAPIEIENFGTRV